MHQHVQSFCAEPSGDHDLQKIAEVEVSLEQIQLNLRCHLSWLVLEYLHSDLEGEVSRVQYPVLAATQTHN